MHKDDCIWTEPNRCNCGWLQDIAKNPCEAVREIERLRAELAECKQDAERYRWLREHWDDVNHPVDFIICNSFVTTLDADVDAARKGEVET